MKKNLLIFLSIIILTLTLVMASPVQAWEFPPWVSGTDNMSGGGTTNYGAMWTGPLILGNATNTDTQVANAVSLKHTAGTDTALGTLGTKNPPIDADLAVYRDSTSSSVLVTSTWTQVKAFLKTYFDGVYAAVAGTGLIYPTENVTAIADNILVKKSGNTLVAATNTDSQVAAAVILAGTAVQPVNIKTGSAQINLSENTTAVTGLGFTPLRVFITLTSDSTPATYFWVSNKISGGFTIHTNANVTDNTTFDWRAASNEHN